MPRWAAVDGWQSAGLLSPVTTVPCQETHGRLFVSATKGLPVSTASSRSTKPCNGLKSGVGRLWLLQNGDVLGFLQGRGEMGTWWGRQGHAGVWLQGRG